MIIITGILNGILLKKTYWENLKFKIEVQLFQALIF